jgi:hypothetical protein
MKSHKQEQVCEAMQFFSAYTRFMLTVALSTGVIVSILDNYSGTDLEVELVAASAVSVQQPGDITIYPADAGWNWAPVASR